MVLKKRKTLQFEDAIWSLEDKNASSRTLLEASCPLWCSFPTSFAILNAWYRPHFGGKNGLGQPGKWGKSWPKTGGKLVQNQVKNGHFPIFRALSPHFFGGAKIHFSTIFPISGLPPESGICTRQSGLQHVFTSLHVGEERLRMQLIMTYPQVAFVESQFGGLSLICCFVGLVAQCSATPATVAATPPCSATPFQTQISVRHLPAQWGGGATPKFLGGVARHRCYTCKTL